MKVLLQAPEASASHVGEHEIVDGKVTVPHADALVLIESHGFTWVEGVPEEGDVEAQGPTTGAVGHTEAPDFDAMDKAALRQFIKDRDGKAPPGFFDETKLRDLARNAPDAQ